MGCGVCVQCVCGVCEQCVCKCSRCVRCVCECSQCLCSVCCVRCVLSVCVVCRVCVRVFSVCVQCVCSVCCVRCVCRLRWRSQRRMEPAPPQLRKDWHTAIKDRKEMSSLQEGNRRTVAAETVIYLRKGLMIVWLECDPCSCPSQMKQDQCFLAVQSWLWSP